MPAHAAAPRLAALAVLALLVAAPALGSGVEEGHWDYLGEDGRVWVPAKPPAATYLPPPDLGSYHNASEAVDAVLALAAARPDLFAVAQVGTSVQGRPITLVTVTAPGDASARTRVLFDGAHHGDEVIGSEILVRYLQRIADEYDTNATMRAILEAVVVDVVPMVNPDGIDHVPICSHYASCRKNANGVDLNRNYEAFWGQTGSSGDPGSATYRGPSPASEPETQSITALLDGQDYALYASLHSGAEMILWPWGHTTTPPPEASVYNQLGGELSALTGAPHGQVSRILYSVSGDSMDQAYGAADGWRAIAVSPETYEGSGSAFDWWYLFNPPDAQIGAVVARWEKFLWHLASVAPLYEPARLSAPDEVDLGPDAGHVDVTVVAGARRPFQGASVALDAPDALRVDSPNPAPLANAAGAQSVTFDVAPTRLGDFAGAVRLDAGPGGIIERPMAFRLLQAGLDLALDRDALGSPETNAATVVIAPGPFDRIEGTLTLTIQPEGTVLHTSAFDTSAPQSVRVEFPVDALAGGAHQVEARATFTAWDGATSRPGELSVRADFLVQRPQLTLDKRFAAESAAGAPLLVTSVYRNTGTFTAGAVEVRETVPAGYVYTTRDGPVPVPPDPLGRPAPTRVEPRGDGGLDLVFTFGDLPAGATKYAQYRMVPLVPGEHALPSAWSYSGDFPGVSIAYAESAAPTHRVVAS